MSDRRPLRAHSPPLYNPARSSAPSVNYGKYSDLHAPPSMHPPHPPPRPVDRVAPVITHYNVVPDIPRSDPREGSHSRRATLDSNPRPIIVTSDARYSGGPSSPARDPYRSSQDNDIYTIPSSSTRRGDYRRGQYNMSVDNADIGSQDRESGRDRLMRVGSGREGAIYPRSRTIHSDTLVRVPDGVAADYGDNDYGYTNPRDLVQYDLDMDRAPRRRPRRESYESSRSSRPTSISGYGDILRPYESRERERERERGPPPSSRGFDKIPQRGPVYDAGGMHMPMPHDHLSTFGGPPYATDSQERRSTIRRPVSAVYDDEPSRRKWPTDAYDMSEDEMRERRPRRTETFDEGIETRGFGIRAEVPPAPPPPERNERNEKPDYDKNDRVDRDEKIDYDRQHAHDDRSERKHGKEAVAAGLSAAAAALASKAAKSSRDDDRGDRENRDEHRSDRRRGRDSDEERRRRREAKDEEPVVDLTGRDPIERLPSRAEKPPRDDSDMESRRYREREKPTRDGTEKESHRREEKEFKSDKDQSPVIVDLNGRNPVERPVYREDLSQREPVIEIPERRKPRHDESPKPSPPGSRQDSRQESRASPTLDTTMRRSRRDVLRDDESSVSSPTSFNAKDAMDLRALRDALNKQEVVPPPIPPKEPLHTSDRPSRETSDLPPRDTVRLSHDPSERSSREPSDLPPRDSARLPRDPSDRSTHSQTSERFDPRDSRELASIHAELSRAPRGRRSSSSHSSERKTTRVVSPPREDKKNDERPVKGILKPGREKFPEDPTPIREGVAPLKDAKKDGVPPDARWTKISRKLVNPEALERGRERYEAREEFVIVLRVLSKEEVQAYATETQNIRAAREAEADGHEERRRRRKERHERHRRERHHKEDHDDEEDYDYDYEYRRRRREKDSHSESDTTEDERKRIGDVPRGTR